MRKLGEQWIEVIDGEGRIVRALKITRNSLPVDGIIMRKLSEQWIEIIDGQEHMVKAVEPFELCQGCLFNCNQGGCCWKGFDSCHMGNYFIIKDLGILNEDGCLTCPFCGEYPEIIHPTLNIPVVTIIHTGKGHRVLLEFFRDLQEEAIADWNRRA